MVEAVKNAIEDVRPSLQADGGDIEFIGLNEEEGRVTVRLKGACSGCSMATQTLKLGVERYLKDKVPGITEVIEG